MSGSRPTVTTRTVDIQTEKTERKVILGMSGGVDSSVAAHLLLERGFAVEGLFMKNWEEDDGTEYCTAIEDLADAEDVCARLDMPLHTANFAAEYWDSVFTEFLAEYAKGRTPNPDVLCNREIKFKQFVDYAAALGGDVIATGHYARAGANENGEFELRKAADRNKDQTYFLQAVPKEPLSRCVFPLGDYQKPEVREIADRLGLPNHAKKDSTGICFIGERRFADFLARYLSDDAGPITDPEGRTLGEHRGLHYYTVGQRQGINLGGLRGRREAPWYVVAKDQTRNRLIVSQAAEVLLGRWLRVGDPNWLADVQLPLTCTAKIRYRQEDQACRVTQAADGQLLVRFTEPQRAIAPGQYVAFYQGEVMLGGARIEVTENGLIA
jgi:tRNA-specific 2-thiouridylase